MMKLLAAVFVALLMAGCGTYPGVPDFGGSLSGGVGGFLPGVPDFGKSLSDGFGGFIEAMLMGVLVMVGIAVAVPLIIGGIVGGRAASKRKKGVWKGVWKGVLVGFEAGFLLSINLVGRMGSSGEEDVALAVVVLIGGIVGGIVASKRKKEVWKGVFTGLRFLLLPLGVTVWPPIVLPYLVYLPFYFWGKSNHTAGGKVVWNAQGGVDANREEGNFTAYVSKDGQQYGPYTVEQLREYVQQGNFTTGDHACHDGQNWVTIAQVPGFADAGDSVTTPQQDQVVQEHAVEQQPASANASSSPAKKKKIILWTGIALVATLLVVGLLVWLLGGERGGHMVILLQDPQEKEAEASPQSNQSPAAPPGSKITRVSKIDLDDPKTRKKIVAKAVKGKKLQFRGKTGEELAYAPNQQKPYTGWKKWIHDNGRLVGLSQFKNGKLDGLRTWWYPNGRKKAERTYKDGKLWTAVRWKPNGEKCPVTNVVNGSGVVVQLHPKGPVHLSTTFKDGKIVKD